MTTAAAPRIHRVRQNHREWSPPQVAFFDTETYPQDCPEGELHTLRCWTAELHVRRARRAAGLGSSAGYGFTAAELAEQFDIWTEGQTCLWVYAHNLSYDLAVTRLPAELHGRGWAVTGHAVASDSPWLRMKRGQCVLTFADSWGWLRAPLEHIGADVGYTKPPLPDWDGSDENWLNRCQADTQILARAMLQLMDWWDSEQLGSWPLTGSAGGWNTWRHRTTVALPLIVPDEEQTAFDRRAIYGGRREAFRHGEVPGGPFTLLDFRSAYPTIAANCALPSARQGNFQSLPVDNPLICNKEYGIIAEVEVCTDSPRYPVRVSGRIAYPVGRFRTTLAGPEIAEARRLGHLVAIGPGWLHRLAPHMQEWARWILAVTADDSGAIPAVARRAAKHWGRAVIGKTAAKGWRTIPLETLGGGGWDYRPAYNAELQAPSHLIDVCGQVSEVISHGDGDNAYPAILAWVESWVRVYLSRAIDDIGRANVITCDTDGLITAMPSRWPDDAPAPMYGPLELRVKGTYKQVRVLGPQHVITPGDTKLSGIPRSAEPTDDGKLSALLWPKLASQMALRPGNSEPAYLRPRQTYSLAESYVTGWVTADHAVHPLEAAMCESGQVHLLPAAGGHLDPRIAELQASHLKQMVRPLPPKGSPCEYHTARSNGTTGGSNPSGPTRSSGLRPSRTPPAAARRGSWPSFGPKLSAMARKVFSGKIRT